MAWKDIEGFEGFYQASSDGRIKSLDRKLKTPRGLWTVKGRELKQKTKKQGYKYIALSKDNKQKWVTVHKIIAETFISKKKKGLEVNHIDCNKANNAVSNLEWTTRSQNAKHAKDNGRYLSVSKKNRISSKGSKNAMAKIDEKIARSIKRLLITGATHRLISEILSCSTSVVHQISAGKAWKHVEV